MKNAIVVDSHIKGAKQSPGDKITAGKGNENLVVKTNINPVKNAIVVDSHIKGPRKSPEEVCKVVGEKCEHSSECCSNFCESKERGCQWMLQ